MWMSREETGIQWCVKVSVWKSGLMSKVLSKDLFKKEEDAIRFYNECDAEGTKVQLSKYTHGNEKEIMNKQN